MLNYDSANGKKKKKAKSSSCLSPPWQTKLHSSAPRSSDAEETIEALEDDNRSLKSQLEESRRAASRLAKERDELSRRLEERDLEREALRRGKTDLEEQKRLLDRAVEKMTKEVTESVWVLSFLVWLMHKWLHRQHGRLPLRWRP